MILIPSLHLQAGQTRLRNIDRHIREAKGYGLGTGDDSRFPGDALVDQGPVHGDDIGGLHCHTTTDGNVVEGRVADNGLRPAAIEGDRPITGIERSA